jgi:hypothetical protein
VRDVPLTSSTPHVPLTSSHSTGRSPHHMSPPHHHTAPRDHHRALWEHDMKTKSPHRTIPQIYSEEARGGRALCPR